MPLEQKNPNIAFQENGQKDFPLLPLNRTQILKQNSVPKFDLPALVARLRKM
jgi:hypothetical protein